MTTWNLTVVEGIVSGLQRTTDVSGGGGTATTTTHIALFCLGPQRISLRTLAPSSIMDGDSVRVSGYQSQGEFFGLAARNLSTGWISPILKLPGFLLFLMIPLGLLVTTFFTVVATFVIGKIAVLLVPAGAVVVFVLWQNQFSANNKARALLLP